MRSNAHGIVPFTVDSRVRRWSPTHLNARSVPAAARSMPADELFAALDGEQVTMPQGAWHIEVHSIYDEGGYRWVQISLAGSPAYSLTFRLPMDSGAPKALEIVGSWLTETPAPGIWAAGQNPA